LTQSLKSGPADAPDEIEGSKMKKFLYTMPVLAAMFAFSVGCDVDQTREGELPDVDVDVSGDPGQLPAYDVEGPEVDVDTKPVEVTVPDVDVDISEEEAIIEVPDVDVDVPEE